LFLSDTPQELSVAEIRRLIAEAGCIPVERDTLYHEVIRTDDRWATCERNPECLLSFPFSCSCVPPLSGSVFSP
jgi:hypothetical protein